jgi:hypothetical protein
MTSSSGLTHQQKADLLGLNLNYNLSGTDMDLGFQLMAVINAPFELC